MLKIGTHLSVAKGFKQMGKDAISIGANTFQFFTHNPRGVRAKLLSLKDLNTFKAMTQEYAFAEIIAHAPYTLNPCSADSHVREVSKEMFAEDLTKMEFLPGNFYNFHPGSHGGQGRETAIVQITDMLNEHLFPEMHTTVLLETMSGKGTEVGQTFEELRAILDRVELTSKVGICMDTCHLSDSGYDIIHNLDGVLHEFDRIIGLEKLYAFHLNDSVNPPGSHKDRHAPLGEGHIGLAAIIRILNHPALRALPFILETPLTLEEHADEIKLLKSVYD